MSYRKEKEENVSCVTLLLPIFLHTDTGKTEKIKEHKGLKVQAILCYLSSYL